jgi:hypothetical protein
MTEDDTPSAAVRQQLAEVLGESEGDWRTRLTITIPEYARIVGVGRNTAYEAARAGEVATIKVRGRILVCVRPLLRQLDGSR